MDIVDVLFLRVCDCTVRYDLCQSITLIKFNLIQFSLLLFNSIHNLVHRLDLRGNISNKSSYGVRFIRPMCMYGFIVNNAMHQLELVCL